MLFLFFFATSMFLCAPTRLDQETDLLDLWNKFAVMSHRDAVKQLFFWCSESNACSRHYHIQKYNQLSEFDEKARPVASPDTIYNSYETFAFLLSHWLQAFGQEPSVSLSSRSSKTNNTANSNKNKQSRPSPSPSPPEGDNENLANDETLKGERFVQQGQNQQLPLNIISFAAAEFLTVENLKFCLHALTFGSLATKHRARGCKNGFYGNELALKKQWLSILILRADSADTAKCGVNEQLTISVTDGDAYCSCINNRNCEGAGNWRSSWTLTEISAAAAAFFMTVFCIVKSALYSVQIYEGRRRISKK